MKHSIDDWHDALRDLRCSKHSRATHCTIVIRVADGTGDYGTSERCVFDTPCSLKDGKIVAQFFADHFQTQTTLFKGRSLGHYVDSYQPQ